MNSRSKLLGRHMPVYAPPTHKGLFRYHMSLFYPNNEMTLPLSVTKAAVMAAQVLSSPVAAILMSMDGFAGLPGWQLLCLVEGGATMLVGLSLVAFLPKRPEDIPALTVAELAWIEAGVSKCALSWHSVLGCWRRVKHC
jgi:hypothetical protein